MMIFTSSQLRNVYYSQVLLDLLSRLYLNSRCFSFHLPSLAFGTLAIELYIVGFYYNCKYIRIVLGFMVWYGQLCSQFLSSMK